MFFLIAYDIADDKRLYRVAKLMEDYGTRVQRSVFECRLDQSRLEQLIKQLKTVIKRRQDKVQLYRLCEACQQRYELYGRGSLALDAEIYIC